MAIQNPFTPMFGGKPSSFFGREDVLRPFETALISPGSDYRTLFFTGTRGSGKTTLLRQLSLRAEDAGWDVLELPADTALRAFARKLAPYDERTEVEQPSGSVQLLGFGGSFGGLGHSETRRFGHEDLPDLLLARCKEAERGVMVVIDEIQKMPVDDVSSLCSAFQMVSSKGLDLILAVAGLPYAHDAIIHHEGCTFMRRARHIPIGLLSKAEVTTGFTSVFASLETIEVTNPALDALIRMSSGQPYLMQLLGFEVVERARTALSTRGATSLYRVDEELATEAFNRAYDVYARQALEPIMTEVGKAGERFLKAMVDVMDERHEAKRESIAQALSTSGNGVSTTRKKLLDQGVIVQPRRGWLRFNIPYLRRYIQEGRIEDIEARRAEEWDV